MRPADPRQHRLGKQAARERLGDELIYVIALAGGLVAFGDQMTEVVQQAGGHELRRDDVRDQENAGTLSPASPAPRPTRS